MRKTFKCGHKGFGAQCNRCKDAARYEKIVEDHKDARSSDVIFVSQNLREITKKECVSIAEHLRGPQRKKGSNKSFASEKVSEMQIQKHIKSLERHGEYADGY